MAKRSAGGAGKPPRNPEWEEAERKERESAEKERRAFVTRWAGYGLPLVELGLLLVPPLCEQQVIARYAEEIEIGQAEQKRDLVGWLWDSAREGNASVQMFLAGHVLGWKRSNPDLKGKQATPKATDSPDPAKRAQMPTAEQVGKIYKLPVRS